MFLLLKLLLLPIWLPLKILAELIEHAGHGRRKRRRTPTYHGRATLPDGQKWKCHHNHRTSEAATECAAKHLRTISPPMRPAPLPRGGASVPRDNARMNIGTPPHWWPRAGWGTVRGFARNGEGFRFYWVPDDGSQPRLFELPGVPARELGEYARGVMQGNDFSIKVSAESMADVAQTFQQLNQMELSKRKIMFADRTDLDGDAGWTWTPDYRLVPVAPGLVT